MTVIGNDWPLCSGFPISVYSPSSSCNSSRLIKTFLNQEKSYEERESALLLYFKTLLTIERIRGEYIDMESIVNENWKIDRPTIVRIAEEALSEINN